MALEATKEPTEGNAWHCPLCGRPVSQAVTGGRKRMYHLECRMPNWYLEKFLAGLDSIEFTPAAAAWLKRRLWAALNDAANKAGRLSRLT